MVLGICRLLIQIPEAHSLKEKRRVVKSLTQRVQARFNVSIAEIDHLDAWQAAGIGIVAASNSGQHADETIQTVIRFVENNLQAGYIADVDTEILHLD